MCEISSFPAHFTLPPSLLFLRHHTQLITIIKFHSFFFFSLFTCTRKNFVIRLWVQNIDDRLRVRKLKLRKRSHREHLRTRCVVLRDQQRLELVVKFPAFLHQNSIRLIRSRTFRTRCIPIKIARQLHSLTF